MSLSLSRRTIKATSQFLAASALACSGAATAQISAFTEDYDSLLTSDPGALSGLGWTVGATVFDGAAPRPGAFKFDYFSFAAPNGGPAFSAVATGDGDADGDANGNYLNVYNDFNCCGLGTAMEEGHGNGTDVVNALVFKEFVISAGDLDKQLVFSFDVKRPDFVDDFGGGDSSFAVGNACGALGTALDGRSLGAMGGSQDEFDCSANAFMKTIDKLNGDNITNDLVEDTTNESQADWASYSLTLDITDPLLVGQTLQLGFQTFATGFNNTGVYYDNVTLTINDLAPSDPVSVPVPAVAALFVGVLLTGIAAIRRKRIA